MFGGFGGAGFPNNLIQGLARQGAKLLKVISNNCGTGDGEPADEAAACAWITREDIVAGNYPTFPTLLPLLDRALKSAALPTAP